MIILIVPILVSFFLTLFLVPLWIKKAKQIDLLWLDMNKFEPEKKIAGSGGMTVVLGFVIGVLVFIAYRTFFLDTNLFLVEILALLVGVLFIAGIGLMDDLFGWQHGGLSMRSRIILVALAAIPFMAINAGRSNIALPLIGSFDLGILYPLLAVPIGIIGATTTFNFLAGFNGLESGQGIILLSAISLVALFTGNGWLSIISLCMVASLLAFLAFNFYPAKIFPGDVLTYPVGGLVAIAAILGNFEKIAIFFFIPYILEVGLKARGNFKKQSFGEPHRDGSLGLKYPKLYGLEHVSIYLMKKYGIKPTEKRVVYSLWAFQLIIILIGFIVFSEGIFL